MRPSAGIGVFVFSSTVVLAGMAVFAGASGCTVLTNDSLPDDAGTFEGGDASDAGAAVCATCIVSECTGQIAACLTDSACIAAYHQRPLAPSVPTHPLCLGEIDAGPDASSPVGLYSAMYACTTGKVNCENECKPSFHEFCATDAGTPDGGDAGDGGENDAGDAGDDASVVDASADAAPTPTTPSVDGCSSCIAGKCGDAKKACAIASECAAYLECTFAAADAAAADECGRQHATGKTAAVELATCTRVGCGDACGF